MLPLVTAPAFTPNNAGSGILSIAYGPIESVGANEFIRVDVSYEVANPTITVDHTGPWGAFSSLTKQHDATDVKGHQGFWIQTTKAAKNVYLTARFSTGVGFAGLWVQRRQAQGTVTLIGEGTPTSGTASTTVTVPAVTGGKLHIASIKAFGSTQFTTTNVVPTPMGTTDNTSRSHILLFSESPFSGTLTPATGTLSSSQNWLCTSASFDDSGSPPAADYVPTWYRSAAGASVVAIPGTNLLASAVSTQNGSAIDTAKLFTDWSGGCLVPNGLYVGTEFRNGPFYWLCGTGHTSSSNEVIVCGPLNGEFAGWNRVRDNTSPAPTNVEFDGSGNPPAIHTYQSLAWTNVGSTNRVIRPGSKARWDDAGDITLSHWYNLNQVSPNINQPWTTGAATTGGFWWAVWDSGTAVFWGVSGSPGSTITSWNPSTDVATVYTSKTPPAATAPMVAACDQTRGIIFNVTGGTNLRMLRPSTVAGGSDFYTPTTSGTAPSSVSAIIWDDTDDRFVVLNATNPNTLFYLTPPATNPYAGGNAWVWSSEPYSGPTVDTPQGTGTYGRFGFVKTTGMRMYTYVNSYTGQVFAFIPRTANRGTQATISRSAFPRPNLRD